MTLTSSPVTMNGLDWDTRFEFLEIAKRNLVQEIKRVFGVTIDYFAVKTKEGYGVLHILYCDVYIPREWLVDTWYRLTGACIVDIRVPRGSVHDCASYFSSQYLSSQDTVFSYRMSQNWIYSGWSYDYDRLKKSCRSYDEKITVLPNGYTLHYFPVDKGLFIKCWDFWLDTGLNCDLSYRAEIVRCSDVPRANDTAVGYMDDRTADAYLGSDLSDYIRYMINEKINGVKINLGDGKIVEVLIRKR